MIKPNDYTWLKDYAPEMSKSESNQLSYYVFNISQKDLPEDLRLEEYAFECESSGVEEYSLNEETVDAILGDRSYSGGDLPESVLDEVDSKLDFDQEKYFRIYFTTLENTEKFQNLLASLTEKKFEYKKELIKDWNAEWKKHYRPILVGPELEIIPAWDNSVSSNADNKLFIYPGMGFGTGSHETTFLCLQVYLQYRNTVEHKRCLDFGCGSGILGLAVLLFEKKCKVDLYDIDVEALHNCNQNIELNSMNDLNIKLLGPNDKKEIQGSYEVIFANILQNVLELEKQTILDSLAPGGLLILSGLLNGQEKVVIDSYQAQLTDLNLLSIDRKNDWVSVALQRNKY